MGIPLLYFIIRFGPFFWGGGGPNSVDKQPFTKSIFITESTKDYTFFLVYSMFDSCLFSGLVFAIR